MNTIQEIFQKFGKSYKEQYSMSIEQSKVFYSILECKTKKLGGHVYKCPKCNDIVYSYNSCNNRHCPNCQDYKKEVWIDKHKQDILNVSYYHIVFTIPSELYKIFYQNKKVCYNLILNVSKETIIELFKDITPGIISMLHTWTQVEAYYPHVHMIVTKGGIKNHKWIDYEEIPLEKLEKKFKNKLIKKLKKVELNFYKDLEYLSNKEYLSKYLDNLINKKWDCYCKKPFDNIESVYKYLAKYVYKVCISNERIVKINKKSVIFKYKDSYDRSIEKTMKLKGEEFIRRFLLHTLPKNFMKIRYYGLYATKNKTRRIKILKIITKTKKNKEKLLSKIEILKRINGYDVRKCKKCLTKLVLIKKIEKKKPPDKENITKEYVYA